MIYIDFKDYSTGHPKPIKHTVFYGDAERNHVNVFDNDFTGINEAIRGVYPKFEGFDYLELQLEMQRDIFGLLIHEVAPNVKVFIFDANEDEVLPNNQYVHYRPFMVGKYKIKARNKDEDYLIQKLLLESGCLWQSGSKEISVDESWYDEYQHLVDIDDVCVGFIIENGSIGFMDSPRMFDDLDATKLITIDELELSLKIEKGI